MSGNRNTKKRRAQQGAGGKLLLLLLALFLFGGQPTRVFVLAMIIGVVVGTYSSLCIASPLWYEMKMRVKGNRVGMK